MQSSLLLADPPPVLHPIGAGPFRRVAGPFHQTAGSQNLTAARPLSHAHTPPLPFAFTILTSGIKPSIASLPAPGRETRSGPGGTRQHAFTTRGPAHTPQGHLQPRPIPGQQRCHPQPRSSPFSALQAQLLLTKMVD